MPKHLAALLSILGFATATSQADAQVLKGTEAKSGKQTTQAATGTATQKGTNDAAKSKQKLKLKQETVRNATGKPSTSALTKANQTGTCATGTCQTANNQAVKGNNQQITKGNNQQLTKANNRALTKANNQAITKGANQQLTKAKAADAAKGKQ